MVRRNRNLHAYPACRAQLALIDDVRRVLVGERDGIYVGRYAAPADFRPVVTTVVAGVKKQRFDRERRQRVAEMRAQTQPSAQSSGSGETGPSDWHRGSRLFRIQYPVRLLAGPAECK